MSSRLLRAALTALIVICTEQSAWAGMPSVHLTDIAKLRLEVISFFLMGLLLSAALVRLVWNGLSKDFTWLPRLTFVKACGVVTLWGLLFVVVLTMISGARELMTPGAWVQQGATYKLKAPTTSVAASDLQHLAARRRKLEALSRQLERYAARHDGRYPADDRVNEIPAEAWNLSGLPGTRYIYVPGRSDANQALPLAYEPELYDGDLFVLLTSGEVVAMPFEEILQHVEKAR